ncbi:MAG: YfhO family protein [Acidobacteriota bacterium]
MSLMARLHRWLLGRDETPFWQQAALAGVAVALVLYWPILTGKLPFPSDIVLSFPPWEACHGLLSSGGSHADLGDLVTLMYPWHRYAGETVREGVIPLWNPHILLGTPFLANITSGLLYPPNFLYYVLPAAVAWSFTFLIRTSLAFVFTALFTRTLGTSRSAALCSGLIFACSGFMVTWQGWPQVDSALWLPAMLLATDRLRETGSARAVALVAFAFAMPVLAGHPEIAVYVVGLSAVYAMFRLIWPRGAGAGSVVTRARFLTLVFTAWTLAVGLAMIQILPAMEWVLELVRSVTAVVGFRRPLTELIAFLSRDAGSSPNTLGIPIPEGATYVGVLTLLVSPFAALSRRKFEAIFFALALLCTAQVVYGLGPVAAVIRVTPVLRGFPNTRMICLMSLELAVLAGLGLDALQRRSREDRERRLRKSETLALAAGVLASGIGLAFLGHRILDLPQASLALWGLRGAVSSLVLWLAGTAVLSLAVVRASTPRTLAVLSCAILGADLLTFAYGHVPFSRPASIYPEPPVYHTLKRRDTGVFRVVTLDATAPANIEMVFGLASPNGYDFATRTQYRMLSPFTEPINPQILSSFTARKVVSLGDRRLDLLNVKYLLATTWNESASLLAAHPERFRLVYSDGHTRLFENLHVLPRAFLVPATGVRIMAQDQALAALAEQAFDPNTTVLTDAQVAALPSEPPGPRRVPAPSGVETIHVGVNDARIDLTAAEPSILVFTDLYYPGWDVRVDGRNDRLLRVDFAFRGVVLSPGRHRVEFTYAPRSFVAGACVSAVALAITALLLSVYRRA